MLSNNPSGALHFPVPDRETSCLGISIRKFVTGYRHWLPSDFNSLVTKNILACHEYTCVYVAKQHRKFTLGLLLRAGRLVLLPNRCHAFMRVTIGRQSTCSEAANVLCLLGRYRKSPSSTVTSSLDG